MAIVEIYKLVKPNGDEQIFEDNQPDKAADYPDGVYRACRWLRRFKPSTMITIYKLTIERQWTQVYYWPVKKLWRCTNCGRRWGV